MNAKAQSWSWSNSDCEIQFISGQHSGYLLRPKGKVKAQLLFVHGLCEHAFRFFHLSVFLARHGYQSFHYDLAGHGPASDQEAAFKLAQFYAQATTSSGEGSSLDSSILPDALKAVSAKSAFLSHGYAEKKDLKIQQLVEQCIGHMEHLNSSHPDLKLFLVGHSLGGLVACRSAMQIENPRLSGLILSSPGLRPTGRKAYERCILNLSWKIRKEETLLGRGFSFVLSLLASLPIKMDVSWASIVFSDLAFERELHCLDPWISSKVPLSFLAEIETQMLKTHKEAFEFKTPLLLFASLSDQIVNGEGSREFLSRLHKSDFTDVQSILDEDCFAHDLLRSSKESFYKAHLLKWLNEKQGIHNGKSGE